MAGIGVTNQRETTIIWDRATSQPIHNAIVWQCRRTADFCQQLRREGFDRPVQEKTGLVLDAYFSGTKVAWLLDNVPEARARAERGELAFGTVDSWLIWNLTGGQVHATDVSNASRTMLYNIHTADWDDELLSRLNIPRALLPNVLPSSASTGKPIPTFLAQRSPLAAWRAINRRRPLGRPAIQPAWSKIPTVQAASC